MPVVLRGKFSLRRACALLTLATFVTGMCGVPAEFSHSSPQRAAGDIPIAAASPVENSTAEANDGAAEIVALTHSSRGCCCSAAVRQANHCCCKGHTVAAAAPKSCCNKREATADAPAQSDRDQPENVTWIGCHCGTFSTLLVLACGEPRLLSAGVALETVPAWNGCVESAAPLLPLRTLAPETPPPRPMGC